MHNLVRVLNALLSCKTELNPPLPEQGAKQHTDGHHDSVGVIVGDVHVEPPWLSVGNEEATSLQLLLDSPQVVNLQDNPAH